LRILGLELVSFKLVNHEFFFLLSCMFMFAFMVSAQGPGGRGVSDEERAKQYEELKKELTLSDQQVDSLRAIDREFFTKMREARERNGNNREKNRADMTSLTEKRNVRIKTILTEEQYTKYQKIESGRRQRRPGGSERR
jgi:ribosomal protein L29